jgi:hypothetical protein
MNDRTPCVDHEALVTYLYDECEPAERHSIAAHVALCASCAEEVQALSDTRTHLASWSPPALPLGFQMTRVESDQPAKVLRPAAWYRQPLPAWAQVAAAVVIFAAGMTVNAARSSTQAPASVGLSRAPQRETAAAPAPVSEFAVTRAEFARLEARLRAMESADVSRASYEAAPSANDDLRAQVNALTSRVAISENQNRDFRDAVAVELNAQRRDIDANRETAQKVTLMDEELQGHRKVLLNPGLLMRTALTSSGR